MNYKNTRGFTLVELMIALLLGIILTTGFINLLTQNAATNRFIQANAGIQDNARFVIDELISRTRMIGYVGCLANLDFDADFYYGLNDANNFYLNPSLGVFDVYDSDSIVGTPLANLNPAPIADSDILVFRGVNANGANILTPQTNESNIIVTSLDASDDDIFLISDCTRAAVFQATSVTDDKDNGSTILSHEVGSGSPGNKSTNVFPGSGQFMTEATVYPFQTSVYYVALSGWKNEEDESVLALYEKINTEDPVELVSGVSQISVELGVDDDNDQVPNRYVKRSDLPNDEMENVVSVNYVVSVNSIERHNFRDGNRDFIVRPFTASANIRNR